MTDKGSGWGKLLALLLAPKMAVKVKLGILCQGGFVSKGGDLFHLITYMHTNDSSKAANSAAKQLTFMVRIPDCTSFLSHVRRSCLRHKLGVFFLIHIIFH